MGILSKLKTVFRGDIPFYRLPHELRRRQQAARRQQYERKHLDELNAEEARLLPEIAKLSSRELLDHFKTRTAPVWWTELRALTEDEKRDADLIVENATWDVMGFGPMTLEGDNVWRRDPISGHDWGLEYHGDTPLARNDGSDVRVLWEVNRFGHSLPLALAFSVFGDERHAETFFSQIEAWTEQNPYGRGANWGCAMEVALRAANLLTAFDAFRIADAMTEERVSMMLRLFDQHGRFIVDNNEFSYIATSNHYLSDVVGLFWIGTLMPELEHAREWRDLGLSELLKEMDKQVLPDGADFEASTGYHRFVTEMLLHTFDLAKKNEIAIPEKYSKKLMSMVDYLRAITRPDGKMPLVGDCDGSRFIPLANYSADDSQFLLDMYGSQDERRSSIAFPDAGIYVLRCDDLYLHFNASDCGLNGRGSHGHNDALSVEVFAFGRPFIVDPGSYAYNLDLNARHKFRSTGYHSTVIVDDAEQNSILRNLPFIIGNEAAPKVREWSTNEKVDRVTAEHYGYRRLKDPVTHRRIVEFDKNERRWRITDELAGEGDHKLSFAFHLAPGVKADLCGTTVALSTDDGHTVFITTGGIAIRPALVDSYFAPNYGERISTKTLIWEMKATLPVTASFDITAPINGKIG
jgi:hypothetical protein